MSQSEEGHRLLQQRPLSVPEYSSWVQTTHAFIVKAFGSGSDNEGYFLTTAPLVVKRYEGEDLEPKYRRRLELQLATLSSCVQQLRSSPELRASAESIVSAASTDIFIVHGHDEAAREATARLLAGLGLNPIILHEQANKGRTVIQKFEDYARVGFAVVLLTPDDRGGRHDEAWDAQRPRARQNVWLELGFFLGKLGRDRVCALYRRGVEIPSDYQGVILEELDAGGAWQYRLAEELKAAGYPVDLNRVRG